MGHADFYKHGDWNATCDVCGRKFKASELRRRWDGVMVCKDDFEFRHPQDYVRGVKDVQAVPFTRPEAPDAYILACSLVHTQAIPNVGLPGCIIPGRYNPTVVAEFLSEAWYRNDVPGSI